MKSCLLTFFAVLAAIVIAIIGFGVLDSSSHWQDQKPFKDNKLAGAQRYLEMKRRDLQTDSDKQRAQEDIAQAESELDVAQGEMLLFFGRKPTPLTQEEKQQVLALRTARNVYEHKKKSDGL